MALAAGIRWGLERSIVLAGVVTLAVLLRATFHGGFGWVEVFSWVALAVGTFTAGVGLAFLGDRNRLHAAEHEFLARLTGLLQVEKGVAESLAPAARRAGARLRLRKGDLGLSRCGGRADLRVDGGGRPVRAASARRICRWRAATLSCWIIPKPRFAGIRWKEPERVSAGTGTTGARLAELPRMPERGAARHSACARC